jgi:hypothetical protein
MGGNPALYNVQVKKKVAHQVSWGLSAFSTRQRGGRIAPPAPWFPRIYCSKAPGQYLEREEEEERNKRREINITKLTLVCEKETPLSDSLLRGSLFWTTSLFPETGPSPPLER